MDIDIDQVTGDKKAYLELLLLGDEQEDMIDRYLDRGIMYILTDRNQVLGQCVVTDEGNGVLEIKNIAIRETAQGKGLGRMLVEDMARRFQGKYTMLQVGTGDSPSTLPFYEKCGFVRHHIIPNFFTDHYDHPIVEQGKQLRDMIVLRRAL